MSLSSCGNLKNGKGFLLSFCILMYLLQDQSSAGRIKASSVIKPTRPAAGESWRENRVKIGDATFMTDESKSWMLSAT